LLDAVLRSAKPLSVGSSSYQKAGSQQVL